MKRKRKSARSGRGSARGRGARARRDRRVGPGPQDRRDAASATPTASGSPSRSGVIHGDERAGLGVLDQISAAELDGVQLWVIPSVNPDGSAGPTAAERARGGPEPELPVPLARRGAAVERLLPGPRPGLGARDAGRRWRSSSASSRRSSVWYHQPWGAVLACRGTPEAAVRYAKLAGMRTSCRGKGLRGTAISWQRDALPGSQAFVVEFGAGGDLARDRSAPRRALSPQSLAMERRRRPGSPGSPGSPSPAAPLACALALTQAGPGAAAEPVAGSSAAPTPADRQAADPLRRDAPERHGRVLAAPLRRGRVSALTDPKLIVIHYAEAGSISSIFNTFAPNRPDVEYNELPGRLLALRRRLERRDRALRPRLDPLPPRRRPQPRLARDRARRLQRRRRARQQARAQGLAAPDPVPALPRGNRDQAA